MSEVLSFCHKTQKPKEPHTPLWYSGHIAAQKAEDASSIGVGRVSFAPFCCHTITLLSSLCQ